MMSSYEKLISITEREAERRHAFEDAASDCVGPVETYGLCPFTGSADREPSANAQDLFE